MPDAVARSYRDHHVTNRRSGNRSPAATPRRTTNPTSRTSRTHRHQGQDHRNQRQDRSPRHRARKRHPRRRLRRPPQRQPKRHQQATATRRDSPTAAPDATNEPPRPTLNPNQRRAPATPQAPHTQRPRSQRRAEGATPRRADTRVCAGPRPGRERSVGKEPAKGAPRTVGGLGGSAPQNDPKTRKGERSTRALASHRSGGAGNRTRVLRRLTKTSPCAVRCVSARLHRSRELAGVTSPVAVRCPTRSRDRTWR